MTEQEVLSWIGMIPNYSSSEIIQATNEVRFNVDTEWHGPPRRNDVIIQLIKNRQSKQEETRRGEGEKILEEMRELKRQAKDNSVQFFGIKDLINNYLKDHPEIQVSKDRDGNECPIKIIPENPPEDTRRRLLAKQKIDLLQRG